MKQFRKTERKSWFRKLMEFIFSGLYGNYTSEEQNFRGHENRMESRRRKTMFDRW